MTEKRKIGTSRIIPGPLLINGYSTMEFVHMLEQLRETEGFDPHKGLKITVEQGDAPEP